MITKIDIYAYAIFGHQDFLFQSPYRKRIGPIISKRRTIITAGIPYKVIQKNGNPSSYLIGIANIAQIAQRTESAKIILSPSCINSNKYSTFRKIRQKY